MRLLLLLQENSVASFLIVGLGNPGKAYEGTRHNVGFRVVKSYAEKAKIPLRYTSSLSGDFGQGIRKEKKVLLLLPMTFMNCSGEAVSACMRYYKLTPDNLLVVSDDIDLPLAQLRLKAEGSHGGHRG